MKLVDDLDNDFKWNDRQIQAIRGEQRIIAYDIDETWDRVGVEANGADGFRGEQLRPVTARDREAMADVGLNTLVGKGREPLP